MGPVQQLSRCAVLALSVHFASATAIPSDLFTPKRAPSGARDENFAAKLVSRLSPSVVKIETVSVNELPVRTRSDIAKAYWSLISRAKTQGTRLNSLILTSAEEALKQAEPELWQLTDKNVDKIPMEVFSQLQMAGSLRGAENSPTVKIPLTAVGSGFIAAVDRVKRTALVVTNSHVVTKVALSERGDPRFGPNAERVAVLLQNGKSYNGTVLGKHEHTDVAVIRLDNFDEPSVEPIEMEDSSKIEPGQWNIIIGAPLALDQTTTVGVVSNKRRYRMNPGMNYGCTPLIQTDTAINSGNSGGPAITEQGKVMGIVTSKLTKAEEIGFVVPANSIKLVMHSVLTNTPFPVGKLGVSVLPSHAVAARIMTTELGTVEVPAESQVLRVSADDEQLLVANVLAHGPAQVAGLQEGDSLMAINGRQMKHPEQVSTTLCDYAPGDKLKVSVVRKGKAMDVHVTLGAQSDVVKLETAEATSRARAKRVVELQHLQQQIVDRLKDVDRFELTIVKEV